MKCKRYIVQACAVLLMSIGHPALAQQSSLSDGFTIIEFTAAARDIIRGNAVDTGNRQRIMGSMLVLMNGAQGYAATSAAGLNCHSWVQELNDSAGRTLFGRGSRRRGGELMACTEFSLRQHSADSVTFGADGREEELRIIRQYPATVVDWSQEIFDRFTIYDQRLGPMQIEFRDGYRNHRIFASIRAPLNTPSGPDVASVVYEIDEARKGGSVDVMWASYKKFYREAQPLADAFRDALVKRYGPMSVAITTKQSRLVYIWAHDLAGKLIAGPEENVERCYQGPDITVREPLGTLSKSDDVGPWSCGLVLAVTAAPARGSSGSGADVIYEFQMILYHGHALGLRKYARRQKQILVTRDEINAIYDVEKPTF